MSPLAWTSVFLSLTTTLRANSVGESALTYQPQPYTINVDPNVIEEIRLKVSKYQPTPDTNAPPWFDGPPASTISSIAKYWAEEYNWTTIQTAINANFSHFYTTVSPTSPHYNASVDLHFIHERSPREDATPILLLHGWPSTNLEWRNIIPGLANPPNASDPAFHVVAPSIPGYGFSPALNGSRVNVTRQSYAAIFDALMQQLGYPQYILYSTDLGFGIALSLVVDHQPHIINHISDFYLARVTPSDQARFDANQTSPEETAYIQSSNAFFGPHSGYSHMHSTFPLTLAYALNDSPVGFLAWMYHIDQTVSDRPTSHEEIVTKALLLFLPGVYNNVRLYKEIFAPSTAWVPDVRFTVPTSILQFGGDMYYPDMANWTYRTANVTYFARHDKGAHFPAVVEPELVLGHIRTIFAE
ncbi:alpha/beta-hydrolase [Periconia macrospinosa]|uniref:Alpha/beta-hydrolase n=1 Tax=Periconia macrospinosa TaxID=97972 RepID=A0A2V1DJT6_9PLEO|nr:alpha/beta-hydrolase [Periconia macrospinosa]